jgi:anti-anti-sigma factor
MSTATPLSELLRRILLHPTGDVAGLVDDLLAACLKLELQLDCRPDRWRVRAFGGDWEELNDLSLPKSVFRAILARLAALCNERTPDSVSPDGGQGELSVGVDPAAVFRVVVVNTPAGEQFHLAAATPPAAGTASQRTPQLLAVERHGAVAVLTPAPGVADLPENELAATAEGVLAPLKQSAPAGLIINLSKVEGFGSAFISFLLKCHLLAKRHGIKMAVAGCSPQARELLHLTALDSLWPLYDTQDEALAAVGAPRTSPRPNKRENNVPS